MRYMVIRAKPLTLIACSLALCCLVTVFAGVNNAKLVQSTGYSYPVYSVETPEKKVALGINCAWDNSDIPQLLTALDAAGIKASFFVSGSWCNKFPESVRQLAQAGHEVGSHSNTHTDMTTLDREGILQEITRSSEKIRMLTGKPPTVFRPPSGSYNDLVVDTIREAGLTPIQWDCDSVDYLEQTPAQMQERILSKTRNGSIFLFHSGGKGTADALPTIIAEVQARGYQFVTVSELLLPEPTIVDFEGRQRPA